MTLALADAIDTLDVPTDGEGLASVLALRDRLEAKIVAAVCAFDDTNEWDTAEGCASLGAWLRVRGRMTAGDATRLAKTARRLRHLPTLREAWLSGEVSGGHVATVVANLNDRTVTLFRDQEDDLVPVLAQVEVGAAAPAMKAWAAQARELLDDDPTEPDPDRTAHLSPTLNGGRLDANLSPTRTTPPRPPCAWPWARRPTTTRGRCRSVVTTPWPRSSRTTWIIRPAAGV